MAKGKSGLPRILPHERLVEIEYNKVKIYGYAFGSDKSENIFICLPADQLEKAGVTGHGPCINRPFHKSKVTFIEGATPVILKRIDEDDEKEEEEDV